MRRTAALLALAAGAALLLGAPDALAHGTVGREDLPIPRWLFGWAATAVLVLSFVALAVLWPQPRLERSQEREIASVPRALDVLTGLIGVVLFGVVIWAGIDGAQSAQANLTPTFVFVLFWVGIPVLSVLFGDVFRAFNPWRAIGRAAGWLAKRAGGDRLPDALPYPDRLGRWPAVVGLLLFAWVELVYAQRDDPSTLAVLALAYAAVQLVGMALYGVEAWTRNGDAFGVYFRLYSSLSPLHWRDGRLFVRRPLSGATELRPLTGTLALLAVAIGTTTFDGLSENEFWTSTALDIQGVLEDVGLSAVRGLEVAYTLGMLGVVLLCGLLFWLGVLGMRSVDRRHGAHELAGRFAHSLIPIALAYVVAHDRALALFTKARDATRSQYWMLAVMVAFTSLGLWLLSAAAQQ